MPAASEDAPAERQKANRAARQEAKTAGRFPDLLPRILSALVLGAVAASTIVAGGVWSALLASAAGAAMAWEYRSILTVNEGGFRRRDAFFPVIVAFAPLIAHLQADIVAPASLILGGVVASIGLDRRGGRDWRWTAPGLVLLGGAAAAFVFLRDQPQFGLLTIVWLVLVVVASDVGGYFAGRLIGGPKLAPTLSPKKTWAGLFGGLALAFCVGAVFSWMTTGTYAAEVCTVSMIAALVAQGGDLAESALKRRFGVKDASRLIPGHGGALDRLDGLMAATLVVAAVTFARDKEVFIW